LLEQGLNVRIGLMPAGEDPDSYCLKYGSEKMDELLKTAPAFAEFIIGYYAGESDLNTPRGKSNFVRNVLPYLHAIPDEIERGEYVELLSETAGIDRERLLKQLGLTNAPGSAKLRTGIQDPRIGAREKWERFLVHIFLNYPEKFDEYRNEFQENDFQSAVPKTLFRIVDAQESLQDIALPELLARVEDSGMKEEFTRLAMEPELLDDVVKNIKDILRFLRRNPKTKEKQKELWKTAAEQDDKENFDTYQKTYFQTIRNH
jgi:DNA primase